MGCSGCLIEAILCQDERRVCNLLSAAVNVDYSDTYWVPRNSIFSYMAIFPTSFRGSPMLARQMSTASGQRCTHPQPLLEESLVSGLPANIALSVVIAAMLYTMNDFNGLQMLVESEKFDLREPLIFYMISKNS